MEKENLVQWIDFELKSTFGNNNYWFNTSKFKNAVEIKIRSEKRSY